MRNHMHTSVTICEISWILDSSLKVPVCTHVGLFPREASTAILRSQSAYLQILATDRKRQATRQALRALRSASGQPSLKEKVEKVWFQTSSMTFQKTAALQAITQLEAGALRALAFCV
jgi:hypothetical protein